MSGIERQNLKMENNTAVPLKIKLVSYVIINER